MPGCDKLIHAYVNELCNLLLNSCYFTPDVPLNYLIWSPIPTPVSLKGSFDLEN